MKPTIWNDKKHRAYICAYIGQEEPNDDHTEEYMKFLAFGTGKTFQEAYRSWFESCENMRKELEEESLG